MEAATLMIGYTPKHLPMSCFRRSSHGVKAAIVIVVLSCILFQFAGCGPCILGEPKEKNDACQSLVDNSGTTSLPNTTPDSFISDGVRENSQTQKSHDNCLFPSTLHGFSPQSHYSDAELSNSSWWSSDSGISINGRTLSCSLTAFRNQKDDLSSLGRDPLYSTQKSSSFDGSYVEIDPPVLDWGERNHLYAPAFAFLTVSNNCNDSILHVHQPFSTDSQFFPCNYTEAFLGPNESTSICFVFLPKQTGLSSTHLILQTNSGGFLVEAKGYAAEFPYGQPLLLGSEISTDGRWRQNLSLFNPFEEPISVKELALWVFVSNTSINMEATCNLHEGSQFPSAIKDWFLVTSRDSSLLAMQPRGNWVIRPNRTETIMEIDFSFGSVGKMYGAFWMKLMRSSQGRADIIMVPVEAEIDGSGDITGLLTVSLDTMDNVVTVSLRNSGSYVVKVTEVAGLVQFQVKSMEGLLLFPSTVTQIAFVTCKKNVADVAPSDMDCKFVVQTNGSRSQIEVSCEDIVYLCDRHRQDSTNVLENPHQYGNKRTGSFDPGLKSVSYGKEPESATLEQVVSQSWKSQGTNSGGISILKHSEVKFPIVLVGNHFSKWIVVQNPTPNPVVMQLILNSEETIDGCRAHNTDTIQLLSSATLVRRESTNPSKHGFSLSENARTEAYVHPNGTAYLGPIVFHPSNICEWRSSGLVRNNLSGVEWFSLQGRGGSYALELLLGKTEPVQNLEFKLEVPDSLNSSTPGGANVNRACSVSLMKELYAKNTGDLPLELRKIRVSGTDCGLDGFAVQNCSQFTLYPGDSTVLRVTYKSNFLSSMVHGDLELALATGIIVVPMKAAVPLYMLELCKKSSVWVRVKKLLGACILIVSLICVVMVFLHQGSSKNDSVSETLLHQGRSKNDSVSAVPIPKAAPFRNSVTKDKILRFDSARQGNNRSGSREQKGKNQEAEDSRNRACSVSDNQQTEDSRNKACPASDDNQEKVVNLKVETGKEKGRRRRKRKGPTAAAALLEVSSSQSGNSTPSSPLSPVSAPSATPRRALFPTDAVESRVSKSSLVSPSPNPNKPVLLPSATFPGSGRDRGRCGSGLSIASTIAPHARAPGSELCHGKAANLEKKKKHEFTYDIWGDHFCVADLMRRSRAMNSSDSESFFVRGPQTLMTKFQYASSVSSSQAG